MKRQLITITIFIVCCLTAYGQKENKSKALKPYYISVNNLTVFQYIDLLKIDKQNPKAPKVLTVFGRQNATKWIAHKDIDSLITLINSTAPAKCVKSPLSSQMPKDSATIGGQVLYLLEVYKHGQDYPAFLTSCGITDKKRIEELKQFWKEWKLLLKTV